MSATSYTCEQVRVIEHADGHAVVAAVAGSGKTETLVGRVRHLLRGHTADQIAVVMFNKDAAQSFRNRFEKAVRGPAPEIRTFNSMGNKIVNRFVQLGLLPDARIEEKDFRRSRLAKDAFTRVFARLNGDDMAPDKELIDAFIAYLVLVKSDTRSPEEAFEAGKYGKAAEGFAEAFHLFEKERVRQKLRFFEDQVFDPVKLMLRNPETQRYVADKVEHLIVDEAQDMNGIQICLLKILAGTRGKVMLVGDEDQAIYDWRGSKPDYLTRGFERDFSNAVRYTLPHTFRFGHVLSLAASQLITHNANRNPKISISAAATPRTRIHCLGLSLGLTGLGDHVKRIVDTGTPPNDVAVLVRTYSMSVSLELELHHHGIPYFVYGRPPLTRIPEISALLGVLQLASGRWKDVGADEAGFVIRNLLQCPGLYLDKAASDHVVSLASKEPEKLSDAIRSAISPTTKPFQASQIRDRADLLEIIATTTSPDAKASEVIETYLSGTNFERLIEKQSPTVESAQAVLANVAAFKLITSKHVGTIAEFLDQIDPLIDSSTSEPPEEPHVWIGSIHRAKGAQWPHVFVPGLAARSFPRDELQHEQLEAERRLFYVAVTRASDQLYLAHPSDPNFQEHLDDIGATNCRTGLSPVSMFLWEMDIALARHGGLAIESAGPFRTTSTARPEIANSYFRQFPFASNWSYTRQPLVRPITTSNPDIVSTMQSGTRVRHPSFGLGTVDRWIDARIVRIEFDSGDTRMLVASFANLSEP